MLHVEIRIKQAFLTYHSAAFKDSLQQLIHFNGNRFGNKCFRCNEGSLYICNTYLSIKVFYLISIEGYCTYKKICGYTVLQTNSQTSSDKENVHIFVNDQKIITYTVLWYKSVTL